MEEKEKSELVELTGLWKQTDKDGNDFLSGSLGAGRVLVFENKFRKEDSKEPTHRLYVTKPAPKPAAEQAAEPKAEAEPTTAAA